MQGVTSQWLAAWRPTTLLNGTELVGRRSVQGYKGMYLHWRSRGLTSMSLAISGSRVVFKPLTLPNGTEQIGRPSVRGWAITCLYWKLRARTCMREAISGTVLSPTT